MSEDGARERYDVVVVGGGHNGLVAAAYLARAGMSVLVLERLSTTGGAAVTEELFPGVPVNVSPYCSLVSLLPDEVVSDLGLEVQLRPRRTASYAPVLRGGKHAGLMVEGQPTPATAESFRELTGSDAEYEAWETFHGQLREVAKVVAPTMLEPLVPRKVLRERVPADIWRMLVEEPIGVGLEERFSDDLVRGVLASSAVTGTFSDLHAPDLEQNRTFLYNTIGNGTGEWRVPMGGVGSLAVALERRVRAEGGDVLTRAFVTAIEADGTTAQVSYEHRGAAHTVEAAWVLGNVAPWLLHLMLGENPGPRPEGAQVVVSMVLDKLPRLRADVPSPTAFAGTVHLGESYDQLQQAFREAESGVLPEHPPGHLVCPSLTDPSVLGPLAVDGKHLLTYVGVHTPARLFSGSVESRRDDLVLRVLDVVNQHVEEPLETQVMFDEAGNPCLYALAPQDVETALAMPGGHMYHGPLSWPWASDRAALDTPTRRWGVESITDNVLLCGAGTTRGAAISGIGGHNAAMAVLEATGTPGPHTP